jgi:PAT family beta-lactamase induction signal transducer AmpG
MNETGIISSETSNKPAHPIIFFFFYIPFGIFTGYLTVTLAFLFVKSGVSVQQVAGLAAVNLFPQVFKFIWAPLVDTTFTVKRWYLFSTLITAATIFATGIVPINSSNLFVFSCMILISSFARTFISAAINGMAAYDTSQDFKGRVGGYCQAGNLGGGIIGGSVGLWIAHYTHYMWIPSGAMALICVLCCSGLLFIKEPVLTVKAESIGKSVNNALKDVWSNLKTKRGLLALILNLLPLGMGAAGYMFAALAKDWKTGADTLAFLTLALGIATIIGCLIGGWIADLINRQKAYVLFSLLQAACAVGMAFCPRVPLMFIIWTLTYALVNGFVNGAYSAFNLEATGRGAAASKFELYASASYLPMLLMTWVLGISYTKWGASGMLNVEAIIGVLAIAIFLSVYTVVRKSKSISVEISSISAES